MQRWRVPLGFLCGALFVLLAQPTKNTLLIGGIVSLFGLALRGYAAGHIRKNAQLAVTGPYAYTRNPLYLGSFVLGLGFTIAAGRMILALAFAALFLGIYLPVMRVEAQTLTGLFGEEYKKYAESVPLLLPRLTPYRSGARDGRASFDAALYMRYREYRAALGLVLAWSILAAKAFWLR
jgi:hypothetical protein